MSEEESLQCYNRGCGEKYNPCENEEGRLGYMYVYSR